MLTILGRGGHAQALMGLALVGSTLMPRLSDYERQTDGPAIVGVGCSNMAVREMIHRDLLDARRTVLALIHPDCPRAAVSAGVGSAIFCSIFGVGVIVGQNVVIYPGCVVEHGSIVGDHAWLSPGVILCGNVTVKPRAFLGAGAIVLPGVTIGEGARIGAGAVIHHNVADGATVYGPRSA